MNTHSNTYNDQPNLLDKAAAALPGHQTNAGSAGNVAPEAHQPHAGVGTGFDNTHSGIGSHSTTHSSGPNVLDRASAAFPGHQTNAGSAGGDVAPSFPTGSGFGHDHTASSHLPGSTGTPLAGNNNQGYGTSHAPATNTGSHLPGTAGTHGTSHHDASINKPSMGDKITGKIQEVVGKATKDPVKEQEGVLKQEVGKEGMNQGAGGAGVGGTGRY